MNHSLITISPNLAIPLSEISFRSSRSSGPGGQNVNKVESRVELVFDVEGSPSLSGEYRRRVSSALKSRMDSSGVLHLRSQKSRSQWQNKELVLAEFCRLLKSAIRPPKKRILTRPSKAIKEKRLKDKKVTSEKKRDRGRINLE